MRWIALLLLVVGCTFSSPKGMADAAGDSGTICEAWDTLGGHVKNLCDMAPAGSWQISSPTAMYDTDTGTYSEGFSPRSFVIAQPGNRMLRVVSVDSFEVGQGASLRVIGPHSLLVLSWSTIVVAGTIDVSSRAGSLGAGANRQDCDAGDSGQGTSAAGGGGGGGFNQPGKDGGIGSLGSVPSNAGGTFGGGILRPMGFIAGGCRGGDGGGTGGQGGDGGGAIQLTARMSIAITGGIQAGGMGGRGAQGNGGGGGGGSGGFIGLDAPQVTTVVGSALAANGGAGGAGCESGPGAAGQEGQDRNVVAAGGAGTSCTNGANGGNGGFRGAAAVPGTPSTFSGGGGGGGAGYVVVWAPPSGFMLTGVRSPGEVHVPDPEPPL